MLCEFLVLIVASVATVVILLVTYARKNYGELEKCGIPVVKPHFFLGSSPNFYKIHSHFQDLEWNRTYGDVFGVYDGREPNVFVCDPDVVRQIMIKDFDHFRNHAFHDLFGDGHVLSEIMDLLDDDKWKAVRSMMSPTFTSAKLKRMSTIMRSTSEEYVKHIQDDLKKSSNGVIEGLNIIDEAFALFTDLIARITLNIKIDNPKDPNNDFAKAIRSFFSEGPPSYAKPFTQAFPFVKRYYSEKAIGKNSDFFTVLFRKVMSERKKSGQRQDDFVDFLNDFRDKTETDSDMKKLGITESTVIANAVEFFIAGQDSMSAAFSMVVYYLTKYPEVEKKLFEEIDAYTAKHNGKVDHDTLGELQYLNACLTEALRLHPVFHRPERICTKDWEYNGIRIKKGMTVVFPLWAYHRNPKHFPNPEEFDPERFMPHNKETLYPITFGTFGHGPRMCIGMRFAFECLLMFSTHIFQNFRFKARPDTGVNYVPGIPFIAMLCPVLLDLVPRSKSA